MNKLQSKILLHNYLVNNNHLKGNYEYLGAGSNGHAYLLSNNLVLKITEDLKEITAAKYLQEKSLPFIITYYKIEILLNIGYILMDYIRPLNSIADKQIVKKWYDIKESMRDVMNENNLDMEELHWGNCGICDDKLLFFDLK